MCSEISCDEGRWADLPSTVMNKIFYFLKQNDRLNASTVCHNWEAAFHSSVLWNAAVISFDESFLSGFDGKEISKSHMLPHFRNKTAVKFAEVNGRYLKDLKLRLYPGIYDESSNLIQLMENFFMMLTESECEIRKLKIDCDLFGIKTWIPEAQDTFVDIWIRFLENQKHLRIFEFNYWWKYCLRLLECLVNGNGSKLKSLKFSLEDEQIPLKKLRKENFLLLFTKLPSLENLEMPGECFNSSLLKNLLKNNSVLKCINLHCGSDTFDFALSSNIGTASSDEWKMTATKYPWLQIKLSDFCPSEIGSLPLVMPRFMPLTSLEIFIHSGISEINWNNERFFTYMKNTFSETLESFHYYDFRPLVTEELTPHIKEFLLSCSKIKYLYLCIGRDVPMNYIDDICKMQVDNRIDIKKLYIHYHSSIIEHERMLKSIYELYKDQLGNRDWQFGFEAIRSMDEESD